MLEGTWELPEGALEHGGYARRPPGTDGGRAGAAGCVLFVRWRPFASGDTRAVHVPLVEHDWLPGHGNLRVKSLHEFGAENAALVHWPAGERFVPHQHWGGEEIVVLSGVFEDEHGRYPTGSWLLSPHLSAHHPFVHEETRIFVKTGHLAIDRRG